MSWCYQLDTAIAIVKIESVIPSKQIHLKRHLLTLKSFLPALLFCAGQDGAGQRAVKIGAVVSLP
jgi:hypothetical protein